jgi:hypothetical protein
LLRDGREPSIANMSKDSPMRADVYQKLHEFNLHIDQGVATLRSLSQIKNVDEAEIRRYAEYFEELRSSSSGYVSGIVSDHEGRESGRLFGKRRRQEMAEDPMHGGWLEEEREKKRQEDLRKARGIHKKQVSKKTQQARKE